LEKFFIVGRNKVLAWLQRLKLTGTAWAQNTKIALAFVFLVSGLGCVRTESPGNKDAQQRPTIRSEPIASLAYRPFMAARIRGSIIVRECYNLMGEPQNYPTRRTLKTADWKATLNNIVTEYPAVSWKLDSGVVRVSDSFADPRLLAVKIKDLKVKAYDSDNVLLAMRESPEVRDFMTREGAEFVLPISVLGPGTVKIERDGTVTITGGPTKWKKVHFENKTVSEVLDGLTRQFPGFWSYEDCNQSGTRQIRLTFWEY